MFISTKMFCFIFCECFLEGRSNLLSIFLVSCSPLLDSSHIVFISIISLTCAGFFSHVILCCLSFDFIPQGLMLSLSLHTWSAMPDFIGIDSRPRTVYPCRLNKVLVGNFLKVINYKTPEESWRVQWLKYE